MEPTRFVDYSIGVFAQLPSKNSIKKAVKRKELLLNGNIAYEGDWVNEGDTIILVDNDSRIPKDYDLDIEIVYEDNFIVIVNKPAGLVVSGNQFKTLVNAMVGKIKRSDAPDAWKWVKPVHRLDASTSGLVIMSKSNGAHIEFAQLFEHREIQKRYTAIVMGVPTDANGIIKDPIDGQECESYYEVKRTIPSLRSGELSLINLSPKTGRTHQLRIHCANNNFPIVGDILYGQNGNTLLHKGLFLAAIELSFIHPFTNKEINIAIDPPYKFASLLEREERRWLKFKT